MRSFKESYETQVEKDIHNSSSLLPNPSCIVPSSDFFFLEKRAEANRTNDSFGDEELYRCPSFEKFVKEKIEKKIPLFNFLIRPRKDITVKPNNKNIWRTGQDRNLIKYIKKYGEDWEAAAEKFKKTPEDCQQRYQHLINRKVAQVWTDKEDYLLWLGSVARDRSWCTLKDQFPGRNRIALKQRFHYISTRENLRDKVTKKLDEVKASVDNGCRISIDSGDKREHMYLSLIFINMCWDRKKKNLGDSFKNKIFRSKKSGKMEKSVPEMKIED